MKFHDYSEFQLNKSTVWKNELAVGGVINQSVPIVLPVSTEDKETIGSEAAAIALKYEGKVVAIMRQPEFFEHRKEERACRQFGIQHEEHPYIKVGFERFLNVLVLFRTCFIIPFSYPSI